MCCVALFCLTLLASFFLLSHLSLKHVHVHCMYIHVHDIILLDDCHQMTGSGDTTVAQWDVMRGESIATYKSHTGSVKTIDVKHDEPSMHRLILTECVSSCCTVNEY